jgi:predicted NAD/FAD-binding protein
MIQKNFTGIKRILEHLRIDALYARSAGFWIKMQFSKTQDFHNQPMSVHLKRNNARNTWLKLLTMYSYSMPFESIDDFPAELAIPALRDYVFVNWVRVKGGVYSYIEKILTRFKGEIVLDAKIANIFRSLDAVTIQRSDREKQEFDKLIFATPPDQVLTLLSDASDDEIKRFSAWEANHVKTLLHTDTSMYAHYGIQHLAEFDFFQTDRGWGYNAYLNQLCGIASPCKYSLAFQLDSFIAEEHIIHIQEHHTPLYTVDSFRYRDEVVATNGENNTYHVGAYLGDGLHEGAITSAFQVANLIS